MAGDAFEIYRLHLIETGEGSADRGDRARDRGDER
jgi:hypothetical protein